MEQVKRLFVEEEGTEAAEWALMVVVLALAILAGGQGVMQNLGSALANVGSGVNRNVSSAMP